MGAAAAGRLVGAGATPDVVVVAATGAAAVGVAAAAAVAVCAAAAAFCRLSTMPSMLVISRGVSAVPSQAERLDVMVMACASEQAEPLRCSHCAALTERSCGSWVFSPRPLNSATTQAGRGSAGVAGGLARLAV